SLSETSRYRGGFVARPMIAWKRALDSKTFIPVLMPRSRASLEEETMVAASVAYAAMARTLPLSAGSCCCSIEAKAQLRSTTSVVGSARLSPSWIASADGVTYRCSHQESALTRGVAESQIEGGRSS